MASVKVGVALPAASAVKVRLHDIDRKGLRGGGTGFYIIILSDHVSGSSDKNCTHIYSDT